MIGEGGIVVPRDKPYNIYDSDTGNPLLFDRKYVLILHKYFEINCLISCISVVFK